jgi:crotonobetaine/carnitine-CoA ligase
VADETLLGSLDLAAVAADGDPIITFLDGGSHTAEDLIDKAGRVAAVLREAGVQPDDRVGVFIANRVEFLWAYFGALWVGAIAVPLNVSLRGAVLEHMLAETAPTALIVDQALAPDLEAAIGTAGLEVRLLLVDAAEPGSDRDLAAALAAADPAPRADREPWDLQTVLYTSGTTGPSKGVTHCNRSLVALADNATWILGYRREDVAYTDLPLFHANALLMSFLPAARVGAPTFVAARFSASRFWPSVRDCKATVISILGSMIPILWQAPERSDDADNDVRVALAVPAPSSYFDAFEQRFGLRLASLYGLTDVGLPVGTPEGRGRPGLSGIPLPDWECRIVDEHDEEVPDGEPGEAVFRPKRAFVSPVGYWAQPQATLESRANLWQHSGDVLVREPDGWLRFVDRKKDAIRRFGENISAFEVESVLELHPAIAEAAVFAVPSDLAEDEVMAAVVLEEGSACAPEEIFAYARERLAYFAVPRYLDLRVELPKTATAKVRKDVLRGEGLTASAIDGGPVGRSGR